jgi:hypothetical protein
MKVVFSRDVLKTGFWAIETEHIGHKGNIGTSNERTEKVFKYRGAIMPRRTGLNRSVKSLTSTAN